MSVHWTQHDFDAHSDPKIIKILAMYGYEGYGWYWRIIEMLGMETSHELPVDDASVIAYAMRADSERISDFIMNCIEWKLFAESDGKFWSERLCYQLQKADEKSEKARESALKRWRDPNAKRTHSDGNANKVKESKVKESKTKEKKEDSSQQAVSPFMYLLKNGEVWNLPEDLLSEYVSTFTDLNVEYELTKARTWLLSNAEKRKTARGMPKFLNGWLLRQKPEPKKQQHVACPNCAGSPEVGLDDNGHTILCSTCNGRPYVQH